MLASQVSRHVISGGHALAKSSSSRREGGSEGSAELGDGESISPRSPSELRTRVCAAVELMKECSLIRIEDLLPCFPDFTLIDDFKEAITGAVDGCVIAVSRKCARCASEG